MTNHATFLRDCARSSLRTARKFRAIAREWESDGQMDLAAFFSHVWRGWVASAKFWRRQLRMWNAADRASQLRIDL